MLLATFSFERRLSQAQTQRCTSKNKFSYWWHQFSLILCHCMNPILFMVNPVGHNRSKSSGQDVALFEFFSYIFQLQYRDLTAEAVIHYRMSSKTYWYHLLWKPFQDLGKTPLELIISKGLCLFITAPLFHDQEKAATPLLTKAAHL